MENIECSICLEFINSHYQLPCGHIFHEKCIKIWKKNKCPLCRTKINKDKCEEEEYLHFGFGYSPLYQNGPCRFCYKNNPN